MIDSVADEQAVNGSPRRKRAGFANGPGKIDRLPPHSLDAEQGVLGCCLLAPQVCIDDAREVLTEGEAFYDLRHRRIWITLVRLAQNTNESNGTHGTDETDAGGIDMITVSNALKNDNSLEEIGGLAYLTSLPDTVPSAANLGYYLAIVKEKWQLRRLVQTCTEVVGRVYEYEGDVPELLDQVEADIMRSLETRVASSYRRADKAVVNVVQNVVEKFRRGVKFYVGPSFGFNYVDNIVPGMAPGDFIVLAARPGSGKSAAAMQVAEHVAGNLKLPVGFFTIEMTEESLVTRQIFQRAGADLVKFKNGFFTESETPAITQAARDIAAMPIYYDESSSLSLQEFEVKARRMVRSCGVKVFFIDYFQLMFYRGRIFKNKSDELAEVSKGIKRLAKELGVPMFVIAQMNRDIEKDVERKPRLSDLKDTGQLEQDADIVMFLWRPDTRADVWKTKLERIFKTLNVPGQWKEFYAGTGDDGKRYEAWWHYLSVVKWSVVKQRNGPSDKDALMMFVKPWCRLVDAYTPPREARNDQEQMPNDKPDREEREPGTGESGYD